MNLDSLIALAGLLIAVYAIIPGSKRYELAYKFNFFSYVFFVFSILVILYLQFYGTFNSLGWTPNWNLSRYSITPSNTSFLVALISLAYLWYLIKYTKVTVSNLNKFSTVVFSLLDENKHMELIGLLESNLDRLEKIYYSSFVWCKIKNRLKNKKLMQGLSMFFPDYEKTQEKSQDVIQKVITSNSLIESIATRKPYFALSVLKKDFSGNSYFFETYMQALLKNPNSIIYQEIRNNQYLDNNHNYSISEQNKLIAFLFNDCTIAFQYEAWRPIGEYIINELETKNNRESDPYNATLGDFHESGKWKSSLMIGVKYFDIMVTRALHQNIQWHMWLYYHPIFTEKIIINMASYWEQEVGRIDPDEEFPTRYHYIIYEIISCMRDWVIAVKYLPKDQENIKLESTDSRDENNNIPKSSMMALGQIMHNLFQTDKIGLKFKHYMLSLVFSLYFDLIENENTKVFAEALINALKAGGEKYPRNSDNLNQYSRYLVASLEDFDTFPHKYNSADYDKLYKELNDSSEE